MVSLSLPFLCWPPHLFPVLSPTLHPSFSAFLCPSLLPSTYHPSDNLLLLAASPQQNTNPQQMGILGCCADCCSYSRHL